MFIINKQNNEAISLERKTFKELGFTERKHLQEWISKNTNMLGERLLIIQKEFSGFDDTNERLDLLAIDENGNLVIIENKLDDTGRDVTWQALKYVSYCAGLSKIDIKDIFQRYLDSQASDENADDVISDFLGIEDFNEAEINKGDQRIILIAASFRKEVTSTVMWLLEHNIHIKCIRVTPYKLNDNVLIDTEQIIPVKDAEDYLIKLANKKQEELLIKESNARSYSVRMKFWSKLLEVMNKKSNLFANISPSKEVWISSGCGHNGLGYVFRATKDYARIELYIGTNSLEENKKVFDKIRSHKDIIEDLFGNELDWQRLDSGKGSRVAFSLLNVSIFKEEDWERMIEFLTDNMIKFEKATKDVLNEVFNTLT